MSKKNQETKEKDYKTLKLPKSMVEYFGKLVKTNPNWGFKLESQLINHILRKFIMDNPID